MINSILCEIEDATKEYLSACQARSIAQNNETTLLNNLNTLQKSFDEALTKLREQAPISSNWKRV